jgi:O-antigen/teichoic acid export membrane protein
LRSLRRYAGIVSAASVSPIVLFSSRFVRTVILSHLLEPSDLGAAVALSTIFGTCEMLADVGLDQFVMVKIGADRAQAVAAVRQIGIVRGAVLGLAILIMAPIIAELFGAQHHLSSIRWLALVPLLAGLRNWRTVQVQNEYRYGPQSISVGVSSLAGLAVVFPAARWFHDERAMLASLIIEAGLFALVSHLVLRAERVGRVDRAVRREALNFGLPLIANGIGLVALSQADRIMVSDLFGLEMLASYSLIVGLAVVPISVISTILTKILMAFVARSRSDGSQPSAPMFLVCWLPLVVAALYALAVGSTLDFAVPLVYGSRYQVTAELHALVTLMVFSRICRIGPTAVLLGYGQTRRVTLANLSTAAGLAAGFVCAVYLRRVEAVVSGLLLGDLIALLSMLYLAGAYLPMPTIRRHLALLVLPAGLAVAAACTDAGSKPELRLAIVAAGLAIIGAEVLIVFRGRLRSFLAT